MLREYTCIICPNGCDIEADIDGDEILSVTGAMCKRGMEYVRQELTDPRRTIATSVPVDDGELPLVSVRLTRPIPKNMIFQAMDEIRKLRVKAPVKAGTILVADILGTGSDVVVTKNVENL